MARTEQDEHRDTLHADGDDKCLADFFTKIIEYSVRKCALKDGEGCLSVDGEHKGLSHRYYKIKMQAFDALRNEEIVITARGFDAIVLQHEYDHLDGLFFYDRIDQNNPNKQLMNEELL